MDGFEVAEFLSQEERSRDTPIIFVTAAYADDMNRVRGYGSGAVDYIVKPINDVILLSKVRVFLELYRGKQELRRLLAELDLRNRQLQTEIAERQRLEELARHQATHDALTGLPNRLLFLDRLEKSIARAQRRGSPCALFYIDIDDFKPVNDHHGHQAGDELLKAVAQRMSRPCARSIPWRGSAATNSPSSWRSRPIPATPSWWRSAWPKACAGPTGWSCAGRPRRWRCGWAPASAWRFTRSIRRRPGAHLRRRRRHVPSQETGRISVLWLVRRAGRARRLR